LIGAISATEPSLDAAKDIPAIPSTDMALLGCFFFEGRFAWDIAEHLYFYGPETRKT
jgi:hypothetical protein